MSTSKSFIERYTFINNRLFYTKIYTKIGGIYGLTLGNNPLTDLYEATIEALAYETKLIIEALK